MQRACVGAYSCIGTRSYRQSSAAAELLAAEHRPRLLYPEPAERATLFPGERRTRASHWTGSNNHEEQTSSRYHAIVAIRDHVERCHCRPDLQPLAKIGQACRAKGAKRLRRAAGRRAILDNGFEALHLSSRPEEQHVVVLMGALTNSCRESTDGVLGLADSKAEWLPRLKRGRAAPF